jgi:hypothetical protein
VLGYPVPETHRDENEDDDEVRDSEEDVELDEDPDSADIERLDHEGAICPDCGAEVWDAAEICPRCFAYLGGNAQGSASSQRWFSRRWPLIVLIGLLIIGLIFACRL